MSVAKLCRNSTNVGTVKLRLGRATATVCFPLGKRSNFLMVKNPSNLYSNILTTNMHKNSMLREESNSFHHCKVFVLRTF